MTRRGPLVSTNTVQVVMGYSTTEATFENVYHVHKASPWTISDVGDLVAAMANWEDVSAKPQRAIACELIRITATDLTGLSGPRVDQQLTLPIAGTHAGSVLPASVTWAVKGSIGKRGRGRQGRTFWVGLTDTMVAEDEMLATPAADIIIALNTLLTDVEAGVPGALVGVIHQFIDKVWQPDAPFDPILVWAFTDLFLDSQRDRLPGHKRHKRPSSTP